MTEDVQKKGASFVASKRINRSEIKEYNKTISNFSPFPSAVRVKKARFDRILRNS